MENMRNHRDIKLEKAKLCYMDTDSFIIHIEAEDFAQEINKWFDTSSYNEKYKRPLPIGINKKVIGIFKDELGGKSMIDTHTHFYWMMILKRKEPMARKNA